MDIVGYLQSKDIQVKSANNANVHLPCMFCGEDSSKRGRLYINVDESSESFGLFFCHLCGERGGINKIRQHFGDALIEQESKEDFIPSDKSCQILDAATDYYAVSLLRNVDAYNYLINERGLTDESIDSARLGWADGGLVTHLIAEGFDVDEIRETGLVNKFGQDFLQDKITIPYLVSGQTVCIRGKEIGGKYLTPPGQKARLFGVDSTIDAKEVVVSEGEFDQLLLQQMGFAAVGVPGANTWQDSWDKYISDAKRIFITFDNDAAGNAGAEKLAVKLGPRSRIVKMPESLPGQKKIDVSEWVVRYDKGRDDFEHLFSQSKGGLLVSVNEAYSRWLEIEGNPELVGLRFNIESLDSEMHHGLLPGQVLTMIAKTNAGKTIMSLNLFHRMTIVNPDIKVLFISLEQTRNEWFERAHRIHSFYEPGVSQKDTIDYWSDKFFMVDKNRITQTELESCIDQFEYELGKYPDIVAIDYLGYYARGFKGEEYDRTTTAIMGLKAIAKERQIIIYAPHQVNRTGNFGKELQADMAKSSGAVEETSDMMLSIWSPDQQVGTEEREQKKEIHMKVLKSRDGGVNKLVRFQFAPLTLAIVPITDPLYERALKERSYAMAGDTWQQAVYRHRTGDENIFNDDWNK